MARDENGKRDLGADPGPDPFETLQQIRASKPRIGCLGCFVSGGWAVAALVALVGLLVYAILRLT